MDLSVRSKPFLIRVGAGLGTAVVMMAASVLPVAAATPAANQTAVNQGIMYLTSQQQPDGQVTGFTGYGLDAWVMLAYAATGANNAGLQLYLQSHPTAPNAAATEWERNIMAIVAAHQNPYDFGGTNYVAGLKALHANGQIGSDTLVNDDAYGVLALVAAHVPANDAALTDAVATILAHQHADGGFSYSAAAGAASDVDDTAAFLAAVHAAQQAGVSNAGLAAAQASAQAYLLSKQNADGGFLSDPSFGTASNVSSTGVALIALNTLGLGNGTAAGKAADYLKSTQQADGSFPYQLPVAEGESGDVFDTVYAVAGLAGGVWPQAIYDGPFAVATPTPASSATPAPTTTPKPTVKPTTTPSATPAVLGASTTAPTSGSSLPAVGTFANQVALALAALIAVAAGLLVNRRQRQLAAQRASKN